MSITYNVYRDGVLYASGITVLFLDITGEEPGSSASWTVSSSEYGHESAQSEALFVQLISSQYSITATQGALIGGDGVFQLGQVLPGRGGAIAAGVAFIAIQTGNNIFAITGVAGALSGGTAEVLRGLALASGAGAVSAGAATFLQEMIITSDRGAVAGGSALFGLTDSFFMTGESGPVVAGAADFGFGFFLPESVGGGLAAGAATVLNGFTLTPSAGALCAGEATTVFNFGSSVVGSAGALAAGAATFTYLKTYSITGAAGALCAGAATLAWARNLSITGASGAICSGAATVVGEFAATPPGQVANVAASNSPAQITVTWDARPAGENVTKYQLFYRDITASGGEVSTSDTMIDNISAGATSYTITSGLLAGHTYHLAVRAVNAGGNGALSAAAAAAAAAAVTPDSFETDNNGWDLTYALGGDDPANIIERSTIRAYSGSYSVRLKNGYDSGSEDIIPAAMYKFAWAAGALKVRVWNVAGTNAAAQIVINSVPGAYTAVTGSWQELTQAVTEGDDIMIWPQSGDLAECFIDYIRIE